MLMKPIKGRAALLFFVSFYMFVLLPLTPIWAQNLELPSDIDLFAPVVRHEAPSQTINSGSSLTLKAKVMDNIGINEVNLFYRTAGEKTFSSMKMKSTEGGNYTATMPKEHLSTPGFEYYIQATDQAGNISMRGLSVSPLILVVSPAPVSEKKEEVITKEKTPIVKEETPVLTQELFPPTWEPLVLSTGKSLKKPWYKKWWVWTLAAAVVGGVALSGGGGGGGSTAGGDTGAISVSAPIQ